MSNTELKEAKDMIAAMKETMQQVQGRFQAISEQLESQNEMGTRIDHFEKNVAELMTQVGMEEQTIPK